MNEGRVAVNEVRVAVYEVRVAVYEVRVMVARSAGCGVIFLVWGGRFCVWDVRKLICVWW